MRVLVVAVRSQRDAAGVEVVLRVTPEREPSERRHEVSVVEPLQPDEDRDGVRVGGGGAGVHVTDVPQGGPGEPGADGDDGRPERRRHGGVLRDQLAGERHHRGRVRRVPLVQVQQPCRPELPAQQGGLRGRALHAHPLRRVVDGVAAAGRIGVVTGTPPTGHGLVDARLAPREQVGVRVSVAEAALGVPVLKEITTPTFINNSRSD